MLRGHPYHITLIGLFVTAWDQAEALVFSLIAWLFGDDGRARAVFYSVHDNLARLRIAKTLLESRFVEAGTSSEKRVELLTLLKEWKGLAEERNIIVHGIWILDDGKNEVSRRGTVRDMFE